MGERSGGILVAFGAILAVTLIAGGTAVLARSGAEASGPTIGPDLLIGTADADTIDGLAGNDIIKGLGGGDLLTGGPGFDRIDGGLGNDRIRARDNGLDQIDCGPGIDQAVVDRAEDGVFDCERVIVPQTFQKAGSPK